MLKSLCRSFSFVLALSLLLPFAPDAVARAPESGTPAARPSFKSGFSSQRQAPAPKPSYRQGSSSGSGSGGFGSFSSRRSTPPPAMPPTMPAQDRASRNGGFGSFNGGGADSARRSESASSRELTRRQAEENALRTLEERRARSAARDAERNMERNPTRDSAQDSARTSRQARDYPDYRAPAPSYPPERQGGGLGNVVAGAVIANAINRHANAANNGTTRQTQTAPDDTGPKNDWGLGPKDGQGVGNAGAAGSRETAGKPAQAGGASFARLFLWLCLLALAAVAVWFGWRRVRRKRDADKPNYSFERN